MARQRRSPNYPAFGLGEAIEKAKVLYEKEGLVKTNPEAAVLAWGYKGLNGASLRVVSALRQYGLIEDVEDGLKVSNGVVAIVHGTGDEKANALRKAGATPKIFAELLEEYGDGLPSANTLKSILITKKKFNPNVVDSFIEAFNDTIELAKLRDNVHTSPNDEDDEEGKDPPKSKIRLKSVEKCQWNKEFLWPLSDGTKAELVISGERPGPDEIESLIYNLEGAKRVLEKIASQPSPKVDEEQDPEE